MLDSKIKCNDVESGTKDRVDFEEAITACGFGRFNVLLLLCALPGFMTSVYVTSALSYVATSAECDLEMNTMEMGTLSIIPYCGMMCSAMLWGFLSDTLGRKVVMVWGFLALALCEFLSSLSQTYWTLMMFKFFTGFVFNGPFAVLVSYISEMHPASMRAKILVYVGVFYGLGNINLPLFAWSIIPNVWTISLFGGSFELHSWHIFLAIFTIPPLTSGLAMIMLPESPKFLMSRGRNSEALEVFKSVYSMNTGKPEDTYPIKELVLELDGREAPRGVEALRRGISQLKPLFSKLHFFKLLLICSINFGTMLGSNTLRLWFPQMVPILEEYYNNQGEVAPLCHILTSHMSNKTLFNDDLTDECIMLETGTTTYINSLIIGGGTLVTFTIGGLMINKIGKRRLSAIGLATSGLCSMVLYWTSNLTEIVALFTVFVSVSSLSGTALSSIVVGLFPTAIRAMAVAMFFMMGRMGTVIGGLIFTVLLNAGCLGPFIFITIIMLGGTCLCLILPKTQKII